VSTAKEIQAAIPKLPGAKIEEVCEWVDGYLEDQLGLTEEVSAKLDLRKPRFGVDGTHQNPVITHSSNLVPAVSAHRVTSKLPFGS
jgi:hypothetical protein